MATIKQLVVYPIKSCMGIDLPSATLTPLGEQHLQLQPAGHYMRQRALQAPEVYLHPVTMCNA
jgi:uncharacterized protein YcbX